MILHTHSTRRSQTATWRVTCSRQPQTLSTVASLGWVTPGAALYFFPEKPGDLFCSSLSLSLSLFIPFTRVSPPPGCHPTPSLPVRPRFSTILCKLNLSTIFPFGVTPGGPPPSDATDWAQGTDDDGVGSSSFNARPNNGPPAQSPWSRGTHRNGMGMAEGQQTLLVGNVVGSGFRNEIHAHPQRRWGNCP